MSDKSEIEAIRAARRYTDLDITDAVQMWRRGEPKWYVSAADFDHLFSHVDALEARVRAAEELLRKMRRLDINLHSVDKNEIDAYFAGVKHE